MSLGKTATISIGAFWAMSACALSQVPPLKPSAFLRTPLTMVQFQMASGRVAMTVKAPGRSSRYSSTSNERSERVSLMLAGPEPKLEYELATPGLRLTIAALNKNRLRVLREQRNDATVVPLEFTQNADGPLVLTWGTGDSWQERRAASFWHLYLTEPEVCSKQLLPLLDLLRPGWNLAETGEQIIDELCKNAEQRQPLPRQHLLALVAELGHQQFARRQTADRQLRAAGYQVRAFLESYDRHQLDAEQRHRLRAILTSLTKRSEFDAADSVAAWLSSDPRIWFTLLQSEDLGHRKIAAGQLSRLLEEPIDFDPQGPPTTRELQIERLRGRVEPTAPTADPKPASG